MLKRYFPFFLLSLFLANSVGFNLVTVLQLQFHHYSENREENEETVIDLQITAAEMNSSAFHWIEHDEFTFNGRLYDVLASRQEKNVFHFKCHDDTKETALYEELEEETEKNANGPLKKKQVSLKKGLEYNHAAFVFSCSSCDLPAEHYTTIELFAPVAFHSVASPPPWLV